jgi:hypothetical protein
MYAILLGLQGDALNRTVHRVYSSRRVLVVYAKSPAILSSGVTAHFLYCLLNQVMLYLGEIKTF